MRKRNARICRIHWLRALAFLVCTGMACFLVEMPDVSAAPVDCTDQSFPVDDVKMFCSELLIFFHDAVEAGDLKGTGKGHTGAETKKIRRQRIEAMGALLGKGCELIISGFSSVEGVAGDLLNTAYKRCDGRRKPRDYVRGSAKQELACRIEALMASSQQEAGAGFITGMVSCPEYEIGPIVCQVFSDETYQNLVSETVIVSPGYYATSDLLSGQYYVAAFNDLDGDGEQDALEPAGKAFTATWVSAGAVTENVDLVLLVPRKVVFSDETGSPGETVTVSVCVDDVSGIAGYNVDFMYDSAILAADHASVGVDFPGSVFVSSLTTPGIVRLGMVHVLGSPQSGAGELATVTFTIRNDADRNSPLIFTRCKLFNEVGREISGSVCADGAVIVFR